MLLQDLCEPSYASASWSFGQNVAVESVLALYLAGSGECETLLSTGIGLYFWHFVK
jgi:hypothetical protein